MPVDTIRRTHYAGSWYQNDPAKLKHELEEYLSKAKLESETEKESAARVQTETPPLAGMPMALIVPHAGYSYSGQTAAYAYKSVQERKINRIFVLGPSHHVAFRGAALTDASSFATPLGDLQVDLEQIAELSTYPIFSIQANVHNIEHSLEMQLPFIKHCFDNVKIVPIVIGQIDESEARIIGEILKGFVGKDDLVVVSSDFTHYGPRYQYRPFLYLEDIPGRVAKMDGEACRHLSKGDLSGFTEFLSETECTICGMYPCEVLLAMLPPEAHGTLLKYMTSRDTALEDDLNSVSYLSIAFSGAEWPETPGTVRPAAEVVNLSQDERQALLKLAKDTIDVFVKKKRPLRPEEWTLNITDSLKQFFGVFVTINKKGETADQKELRGCIGSIYPSKPLYKAVEDNAISSCAKDFRFQPVRPSELPELDVEISILTPPRRIASYKEIVIGRDGVILSKAGRQSIFLPQVAVEWNWDVEQMLTQLSLKAGLHENDWRDGAKFDVFQAEKIQ